MAQEKVPAKVEKQAEKPRAQELPEHGEFVLATVRKVMPFGAVCSLDEYRNAECFMHISEVSSGWIRNIREHIKEGQKIVALVLGVDREKGHIDVSAKRVSDVERKRKMESYKSEVRAEKILGRVATSLKKGKASTDEARQIHASLVKEWGDAWTGLEAIAKGEDAKVKLSKEWLAALSSTVAEELKPKEISIRANLTLKSYAGDGIERIKTALAAVESASSEAARVRVRYLGAPRYYVDVSSTDYKVAEKTLASISAMLEQAQRDKGIEWSLEKIKEPS
jgi:translation initiation factor 2 subunit 1